MSPTGASFREIPITKNGKRRVDVTTEGTKTSPEIRLASVKLPKNLWLKSMFKRQYMYLANQV